MFDLVLGDDQLTTLVTEELLFVMIIALIILRHIVD